MTTFSVTTTTENLSAPLRYARAIWEFLFHGVAVVCLLVGFWGIEKVMNRLGSGDKVFRAWSFQLSWHEIFDILDLALIVCLLVVGLIKFVTKVLEKNRFHLVIIEEHPERMPKEGQP